MHHASPGGFHQRRDAVWKRDDNNDEDQSDDQLPDIRQVAGEVRAQDIYADCTHKRTNQGPAAAERRREQNFDAGRIEAEVGASLLVIADGDKNTGHLAFDEDVSESAEDD